MIKLKLSKVQALHPRMNQPYRFDKYEQRSVPCDHRDDGASYSLQMIVTKEHEAQIKKVCQQAFKELRANNDRAPDKPDFLPYKTNDNDEIVVKAKLPCFSAKKKKNIEPPRHYDMKNKVLPEGFELTNGSTINVALVANGYVSPVGSGITLYIDAVQVVELAERSGPSPFEAGDGFTAGDDKPAENKTDSPFDDDIPF